MSERPRPARSARLAAGAAAVAVLAWAGWHGHLTPSICNPGADSSVQTIGALRALADARQHETACDGHAMECRFLVWPLPDGRSSVTVEHAAIDFFHRECRWGTDNETHYEYSRDGKAIWREGTAASAAIPE